MTTILVATDGSDAAQHAALTGLDLLAAHARVVLVTVVDHPDETLLAGTSGFAGGVMTPEEFDDLQATAQTAAEHLVREAAQLLTDAGVVGVEPLVAYGDAATALCELASELTASAIVMGSRGRSGFKRAMLGSVSDHVVRNAPCPVVIVGPKDEA